MNHPPNQTTRDTSRLIDITGPENTLILLAAPGDEVTACGGFIAEACARGRPPFVVILGDGAPDGCTRLARERERASRIACRLLGLPDDRVLFVGLRQGKFPAIGAPLFNALQAAMAEISWRRDCNVILAPFASEDSGHAADAVTAWQLACALAGDIDVSLLAGVPMAALPGPRAKHGWRLDLRQWDDRKAQAALAHGTHIRDAGYEIYGRLA
jgi:LmbE family N-acetylglucosaminyl deacetylase